jgi:hypothetical protein
LAWDGNRPPDAAPKPDITVGSRTVANPVDAPALQAGAAAAREQASAIDLLNLRVKERVELAELEAAGAAKTSIEYEKLKLQRDLEKAALKDSVPATDQARAAMDAYAERIVAARQEIETLAMVKGIGNDFRDAFKGFAIDIAKGVAPLEALKGALVSLVAVLEVATETEEVA